MSEWNVWLPIQLLAAAQSDKVTICHSFVHFIHSLMTVCQAAAYVQRETSSTKTCSGAAELLRSRDIKESRRDDVTVTSSRADHVSLQGNYRHHHEQQQQPTSTQYISDTCVLLTYFTGDIESNVDQHFARALSQPSSFGPDYHGTTPPSVHTGMFAVLNWTNKRIWRLNSTAGPYRDGGYIGIYTLPQSVYLKFFLSGCFVSLQWLVNIYTHPNQIPGYASVPRSLSYGRLVTLECTREVINLLYHCRHSARDSQYEHAVD